MGFAHYILQQQSTLYILRLVLTHTLTHTLTLALTNTLSCVLTLTLTYILIKFCRNIVLSQYNAYSGIGHAFNFFSIFCP